MIKKCLMIVEILKTINFNLFSFPQTYFSFEMKLHSKTHTQFSKYNIDYTKTNLWHTYLKYITTYGIHIQNCLLNIKFINSSTRVYEFA